MAEQARLRMAHRGPHVARNGVALRDMLSTSLDPRYRGCDLSLPVWTSRIMMDRTVATACGQLSRPRRDYGRHDHEEADPHHGRRSDHEAPGDDLELRGDSEEAHLRSATEPPPVRAPSCPTRTARARRPDAVRAKRLYAQSPY